MNGLVGISTAGLAVAALGLGLAAAEAAAPKATGSTAPMTVAQVEKAVVGNTVFVRDEAKKARRAQYFSPDGTAKLRARRDGSARVSDFAGTYRFDDRGRLCIAYPALPTTRKEFCTHMVRLGDGLYKLTVGGVFERVLEGENLDELN